MTIANSLLLVRQNENDDTQVFMFDCPADRQSFMENLFEIDGTGGPFAYAEYDCVDSRRIEGISIDILNGYIRSN